MLFGGFGFGFFERKKKKAGLTPWRRKWQPTPVFLPGSPMDRGAWWATVQGVTELDTT